MRLIISKVLIVSFLVAFIPITVSADEPGNAELVVLPFVNYTHDAEATNIMTAELMRQLNERNFSVLDPIALRNILRHNRIRTTGLITAKDAQAIYKESGTQLAMVGSFDFYSQENIREVGLHIRIVDLEKMYVRFAVSVYDVGLITDKLFRSGELEDLDIVLQRVIAKALVNVNDSLLKDLKNHPISGTAVPIGVVELDNLSSYLHAGRIISNQLLQTYLELGFTVIEPGVIFEEMQKTGDRYRGEINYSVAQSLLKEYNMLLLSTGTVEEFKPGLSSNNLPEVELALRMIDGPSQKIVGMYQQTTKGSEYEKLFQVGGCKSIGILTQRLLLKILTTFQKDRHYDEYTKIMQQRNALAN